MKKRFARKGFSLVELVVVILIIAILAVAVFAGGSAVIKKSQVSRTTSDLHNFSVAAESTLNENPSVANIFLLVQYTDGDVSAVAYNTASDAMKCNNMENGTVGHEAKLVDLTKGTATYTTPASAPVNF